MEEAACPTCGSCSGMFTANSMNCLLEALGLALPGNGSTLATHTARRELYEAAGRTVVELCRRHYDGDDEQRPAAQRRDARRLRERDDARRRDGRLDQHRAAPAGRRAGGRRRLRDGGHRRALAPRAVHLQGGAERRLPDGGRPSRGRHPGDPRRAASRRPARRRGRQRARRLAGRVAGRLGRARRLGVPAGRRAVPRRRRGACARRPRSRSPSAGSRWTPTLPTAASATSRTPTPPTAAWRSCPATSPRMAAWSRRQGSTRRCGRSPARRSCSSPRTTRSRRSSATGSLLATWS